VVAIVGVLVAASMTRDGDRRPEAGTAARPGERPERTTQRTTTTAAPTTTTTARPPPPFDGAGPSVVDISKGPDQVFVAYITANAAGRYCGITSYDSAGEQVDLLVNTTEPYEGEVIAPETAILVVQAEGDWAVTDNGRT
jgi:hypothetical protein